MQAYDSDGQSLSFPSQYHTVLLGDLNFNLEFSSAAVSYVLKQDWNRLHECDQLRIQQRHGLLLHVRWWFLSL
jgi:hypothetical protein|eukprot:COSAG01_NODE_2896_length_6894_cov_4.250147_4_plen_73_part_00